MKLYLIPTPIGENAQQELPPENRLVLEELDYFIVENLRTARRFLASQKLTRKIDDMQFVELNEHTPPEEVEPMLEPLLKENRNAGLMSEAGLPCVADPGAPLVAAAHKNKIEIVPLVGASSIMLALMASGANGQNFAFNGYLPIKEPERSHAIKQFERALLTTRQTQIFIETPYRNDRLLKDFIKNCAPTTRLTVALGILTPAQRLMNKTLGEWAKNPQGLTLPKTPAVFVLGV